MVHTPQGPKPIAEVQVGDQVLALDAAGKPFYDTVYLLPHNDAGVNGDYLTLHAEAVEGQRSAQVKLSPTHYMIVACGDNKSSRCHREAREVVVGDLVWLVEAGKTDLAVVKKVSVARALKGP
jgi:hypothetical protein